MVGKCPTCGSPTFTRKERREQAKLAREIVNKDKFGEGVKKILEEKLKRDIEG